MAQEAGRRGQGLKSVLLFLPIVGAVWWGKIQAPPPTAQGGCGPHSLHAVARQLGLSVSPTQVRARFFDNADTCSFLELQAAANSLGLKAQGQQMTVETLQSEKPLGILHIDGNHFVAITDYNTSGLTIVDSTANGVDHVAVWPYAVLAGRWNGRILILTRGKRVS